MIARAPASASAVKRRSARALLAAGSAATIASSPGAALAQLHWDASAQVGAMKRFLGDRPAGASDDAGIGPTAQLAGHVALLPLIHAGAYFGHDISSISGGGATRNITSGGLRAKGMFPFVPRSVRAWVFAGFGYAGVYSRSYPATIAIPNGLGGADPRSVRVEGAGGSFFEVPLGLGASYKLHRPWELSAELGFRLGFGHSGSVYGESGPQVTVPGGPGQNVSPAGLDRFALGLTVGVLVDL